MRPAIELAQLPADAGRPLARPAARPGQPAGLRPGRDRGRRRRRPVGRHRATPACCSTNGSTGSQPATHHAGVVVPLSTSRRPARRRPAARGVPGRARQTWDRELIPTILDETFDLAKIRGVDLASITAGWAVPPRAVLPVQPAGGHACHALPAMAEEIAPSTASDPPARHPGKREAARGHQLDPTGTTAPRRHPGTSLQAQIRDPLWLLARQWQVGEFAGDDAGSPVQAVLGA